MKVNIGKYPKGTGLRKIDVKIDGFDVWSLDHTLANIIYPALILLKKNKHGVPHEIVNDVGGDTNDSQFSFDFYTESHDDAFHEACKRWDVILDKMIWSFEQLVKEDYDSLYHHGSTNYSFVKSTQKYPDPVTGKLESTYQMVDNNPDQHWYDAEGHQLHEDRIREGLELFGKYYRALWD